MMVKTQKYMKKEEGEKQDQANTRPVGMTTSRRAPLAWFKASSMAAIPSSRLSRSMLSAASSRVKSVDVGSYGFIHQSRGLSRVGEPLPADIRARDDSQLAPGAPIPLVVTSPPGCPYSDGRGQRYGRRPLS